MEERKRRNISAKTRFEVLKRDGFACRYCLQGVPVVKLHVDHIEPVVKGGTNDMWNLATSCAQCNMGKGTGAVERGIATRLPIATISLDTARESPGIPEAMNGMSHRTHTFGSWELGCLIEVMGEVGLYIRGVCNSDPLGRWDLNERCSV